MRVRRLVIAFLSTFVSSSPWLSEALIFLKISVAKSSDRGSNASGNAIEQQFVPGESTPNLVFQLRKLFRAIVLPGTIEAVETLELSGYRSRVSVT